MRNQLETFKSLFEQVRGLGVVMQLPNDTHTTLTKNIKVWFAENYVVTSVAFGNRYHQEIEIMKYSTRDESYKVSLPIDITDEELMELIETVQKDFKQVKIDYLESELFALKNSDIVVLEKGEVVE